MSFHSTHLIRPASSGSITPHKTVNHQTSVKYCTLHFIICAFTGELINILHKNTSSTHLSTSLENGAKYLKNIKSLPN